jgi:thiol-disulfide isomerase/thioredoxin
MKRLLILLAVGCGTAPPPAPVPPKSVQVNTPGAPVDVDGTVVVAGYVTVVDFWSESCGACMVVGGRLAIQVALEPDILIRKIDVGDGFTPVAKAYEIGALPHFRVYDKHKRMRYDLVGNDCLKAPEIARQLVAEP